MKAIASKDRNELDPRQEVDMMGGSDRPRRRHSLFLVGTLLLLGAPIAIFESVALAFAIR